MSAASTSSSFPGCFESTAAKNRSITWRADSFLGAAVAATATNEIPKHDSVKMILVLFMVYCPRDHL